MHSRAQCCAQTQSNWELTSQFRIKFTLISIANCDLATSPFVVFIAKSGPRLGPLSKMKAMKSSVAKTAMKIKVKKDKKVANRQSIKFNSFPIESLWKNNIYNRKATINKNEGDASK